jgi:hypothetical protein
MESTHHATVPNANRKKMATAGATITFCHNFMLFTPPVT